MCERALPLTRLEGKKRKAHPFEVLLPANAAGNPIESIVMPQQIRTIAKARLLSRIGLLADHAVRREIEDRMLDHLGISLESGG